MDLKETRRNAITLRKQHLLKQTPSLNIQNRKNDDNNILSLQRIEQSIKIWMMINCLTQNNSNLPLQKMDIKHNKGLKF